MNNRSVFHLKYTVSKVAQVLFYFSFKGCICTCTVTNARLFHSYNYSAFLVFLKIYFLFYLHWIYGISNI